MSYNKSSINLDNCDLYEYVMELDQQNKNSQDRTEHLYVPKIEKIRKDNSMNVMLIVAIVLILLGLYFYINKSDKNIQMLDHQQIIQPDNMLTSYYF